ncbi:MAG: undecaprenyldiphospho-muramoylpentapeptide beta-N-acetylglucosaminyltransferase [Armatimonadetes bacterium]|nr:undecaprenyldiphospho-muramoylpentapeptide beta-N-acetylglucosaminyltransferase [Armatimonadota bacterium]
MRLAITGGGTGGHVFPALEIGRAARAAGWQVKYYGSLRGIEGGACEKAAIEFVGFASEPIYRLYTPRGWFTAAKMLQASKNALHELSIWRPDVLFSTGGYASAPVVHAARRLGIPFVIHEQNAVPGRTNRLFSKSASRVCTVFKSASQFFPGGKTVQTGLPIREQLRASAQGRLPLDQALDSDSPVVLVMGGSQGSAVLNDAVLAAAVRMVRADVQWLHITGESHYESTMRSQEKLGINGRYTIKAYLDADEMAVALFQSSLAICRSGAGTLAELAAFRKPSILVPYPRAYGDHQRVNAQEFADMKAAELLKQEDLLAASLEARVMAWLNDEARIEQAKAALAEWDRPDAAKQILAILEESAK